MVMALVQRIRRALVPLLADSAIAVRVEHWQTFDTLWKKGWGKKAKKGTKGGHSTYTAQRGTSTLCQHCPTRAGLGEGVPHVHLVPMLGVGRDGGCLNPGAELWEHRPEHAVGVHVPGGREQRPSQET